MIFIIQTVLTGLVVTVCSCLWWSNVLQYWCWIAGVKGAMPLPAGVRSVVDEERMRTGCWLLVSVSALLSLQCFDMAVKSK